MIRVLPSTTHERTGLIRLLAYLVLYANPALGPMAASAFERREGYVREKRKRKIEKINKFFKKKILRRRGKS